MILHINQNGTVRHKGMAICLTLQAEMPCAKTDQVREIFGIDIKTLKIYRCAIVITTAHFLH